MREISSIVMETRGNDYEQMANILAVFLKFWIIRIATQEQTQHLINRKALETRMDCCFEILMGDIESVKMENYEFEIRDRSK